MMSLLFADMVYTSRVNTHYLSAVPAGGVDNAGLQTDDRAAEHFAPDLLFHFRMFFIKLQRGLAVFTPCFLAVCIFLNS